MTDPDSYGSTWYAETRVARPEPRRLSFDIDVDVCVVGGGLAGLTVAREAARAGWSVAVLEARQIAWNASGRNCGFVSPGFAQSERRIIDRVGIDHAKALWALSVEGMDYVRKTIRSERMRGVEPVPGWLNVSKADAADDIQQRADLLADAFDADVEAWSTDAVRDVLKSPAYFQALHFPRAFHINPLNYALGLAAAAEQAGARIYEDTPVVAIDTTGVRKRVHTPTGRVRAGHVVLAGNVQLGKVDQRLSETLVPIWSYVVVTDPLGSALDGVISYRGAVSDSEMAGNNYRIVGGDRLLWSGRMTTWEANPRLFVSGLKGDIARTFPRLGEVRVAYSWSGLLGRPVHQMPQIGELAPGVWVASGFSSQGLNTTAMAGMLIARAIVARDQTWRLFLPFELIWAGRGLGRAAAQMIYWAERARSRVASRSSRVQDVLLGHDELPDDPPSLEDTEAVIPAISNEQQSVNQDGDSVKAKPKRRKAGRKRGKLADPAKVPRAEPA